MNRDAEKEAVDAGVNAPIEHQVAPAVRLPEGELKTAKGGDGPDPTLVKGPTVGNEESTNNNEREDPSAGGDKATFEATFYREMDALLERSPGSPRKIIRELHINNIIYTTSKILAHGLIIGTGLTSGDTEESKKRKERYYALLTPDRLDQIRDDLVHYSTAVQNYKTWRAGLLDKTFYYSDTVINFGAKLAVQEYGQLHKLWTKEEFAEHRQTLNKHIGGEHVLMSFYFGQETTANRDAYYKKQRQFLSRLAMALFGGAALIAPMLIMTLHQSKLTSLLTTSLFVVVVAVTLAWWMEDAKNQDVMAATAAYAAVLVVFVGTGTTTTG